MAEKEKIGLVQIGDNFGGQYYLPYAVCLLQAYIQKYFEEADSCEFLLPVYKRESLPQTAAYLENARVVFFSVYLWNFQYSLAVARALKERSPDCLTVFGGPQISARPQALEALLRTCPCIDIACYAEGEIPSLKIMEHLKDRSWREVPSIGFLDEEGPFIQTPEAARIADLNQIPSPYLEGIYEPLIGAFPDENWSAMWESNRGCPFSCSYCAWGAAGKKKLYTYDLETLFQEIDWFSTHGIEFVFCCDANFGIFPERDLKIVERVAENKKTYGFPKAFSVQSTKNATRTIFDLQRKLNHVGLQKGVNLALQSLDATTLSNIRRSNISPEQYRELQHLFSQEGIATFSDLIIGLPGETYASFTENVGGVIAGGQHNRIQFINLTVLENTEMADPEYQKKHGMALREARIVQHHTSLAVSTEIQETQQLVIGTGSMPPEDWVRVRVFCWLTSLLYFNKLLQLPLMILGSLYKLDFLQLMLPFTHPGPECRKLREIVAQLTEKARAIQAGENEYLPGPEWLNIWWPVDEYIFIDLCINDQVPSLYAEARAVMEQTLRKLGIAYDVSLLEDSLRLNELLLKRPFQKEAVRFSTRFDLYEFYVSLLSGRPAKMRHGKRQYEIVRDREGWETWDVWLREVVWYGTKKGAYLNEWRVISDEVEV